MKEFYVYEWFIKETGEIFHVGKGKNLRYLEKEKGRNAYFKRIIKKYECESRIYMDNLNEDEAYNIERKRIKELKLIGEAKTNFHEGGKGGNTFKYMNKNDLNNIKLKIGVKSKLNWENKQFRDKTINVIKDSMNDSIKNKISKNTKLAMQKPEIKSNHLNKVAEPVILKYSNGNILEFKTNAEFRDYIKNTYNGSTRIVYKLLSGKPFVLQRNKIQFKDLENAIAYRKNDLAKSVETMGDECNPV